MRISVWSSGVCSSDLAALLRVHVAQAVAGRQEGTVEMDRQELLPVAEVEALDRVDDLDAGVRHEDVDAAQFRRDGVHPGETGRSEEHTSELQSLMRISYAVFCLKKKKKTQTKIRKTIKVRNTKNKR